MMVGFVRSRDLNGGHFFYYEISKTVGFGGLQDISDGRFW